MVTACLRHQAPSALDSHGAERAHIRMPEIMKKQTPAHKPQRKKNKESHNAVERHRKKKINAGINRIGELLPCSPALKQSKNMILDQALRYIIQLKQQNDILLLNGGDRVQAEEICRLRRQLEELRKESAHYMELLKVNGISFLNDPTVHWKGKLRCAKVAKVTPTHLVPDGIIVYSNGNVLCPAAEDQSTTSPTQDVRKQPAEALVIQSHCDIMAGVGPKVCQNGSMLQDAPASSAPQVLLGASLAPPVCTPGVRLVEQQPAEAHPATKLAPSLSYITFQGPCPLPTNSSTMQPPASTSTPTPSPAALTSQPTPLSLPQAPFHTQAAIANSPSPPISVSSMLSRSVPSPTGAPLAFQISMAGSTQTTWTTLQLGGNSQPVCHPALTPTPSINSSTVSYSGQQGPSTCFPVAKSSVQPVLAPPQIQAQALAPPIPPPPQSQSAFPPLLQVLHMSSSQSPAVPQTPNKPNVFILQPVNPCQPMATARSSLPSQNPCQHIVIIQAPNQNPVPPTSQGNTGPATVSTSDQTSTSSVVASGGSGVQTVGGKQLVHILPRPMTSTQKSQTVTVSGQVFSLQAMKPPGGAAAQPSLQIVQPTTKEDPNVNITLHSLGALANLNQSISNVPTQSQAQPPAAAQPALPVTTETVNCSSSAGLTRSAPLALAPIGGTTTILLKACVPPRTKRTGSKKASTGQRSISKQGGPALQINTEPAEKQPPTITTKTGEISMFPTTELATLSKMSSLASRVTEPSHTATDITVSSSVAGPTLSTIFSPVVGPTMCSANSTVSCVSSIATNAISKVTGPTAICGTSTVTEPTVASVTSTMTGPIATTVSSTMTAPIATSICSTVAGSIISTVSSIVTNVSSTVVGPRVSSSSSTATIVRATETVPTANSVTSTQTRPIATSVSFTVTGPTASGVSISASSVGTTGHTITPSPQVAFVTAESSRPADLQNSLSASLPLTPSTSVSASPSVTTPLSHMSECRRPPSHQHDPALSTIAPDSTLMEAKTSKLDMERDLGDADLGGHALPRKDPSSLQQVCVLEQDALGQSLGSSSCGGSRGFSIASMLPMGHVASTSSSAFGTFTFTSEQAEILALAARAFFEQDGPGTSRGSGCSSHTPAPTGWDVPKLPQSSHRKDRASGSQAKNTSLMGPSLLVPLGVQPAVGTTSGPVGSRNPLSLSYTSSPRSQSQPSHSQPTQLQPTQSQTQPTQSQPTLSQATQLQASTVGSLSVNNLIRPLSSGQQPYTCSPSHTQQGSVPSPIATAVPVVQSSAPLLPPCSEYTPLKNALMRPHGTEHHMKDMSKRPAPDDTLLPSSKRPKTSSVPNMGQMDMKAAPTDHTQMMVSCSSSSSSNSVGRGYPSDGLSGLFPGNSFMSSMLKPVDGHCAPQGTSHQQSHSQHIPHPPGHHLPMGNPYLKQQQQQQQQQHGQRLHLYQLQHHLTQQDPTQFHSVHQRTLQQDQHSQKKRGLVQGGQPGGPMGLPQKAHHVDKGREQQQQHQQQHQQQSSHSRHQHIQHIQQQQFGVRPQEKSCEGQPVVPRALHGSHLGQERQAGQNHSALQRLMSSRALEQLTSQPGGAVSRHSDITCTPSRQERHRVSSYSAEALIGKSTSSVDQRMGIPLQAARAPQDQADLHTYLDASRGKGHNPQGHSGPLNVSCGSTGQHQLGSFEVQVSRESEMTHKPTPPSHRGLQTQGIRMGLGSGVERQPRGAFPGAQGVPMGSGQREHESCHQSFMQSLLAPHLSEQVGHQSVAQCCPPVSMEYSCGSGGSSTDLQAKAGSPSMPPAQKTPNMHISEGNKGHLNPQVGTNMQLPGVRGGLPPHPTTPQSNSEPGRAPARPVNSVNQRARHPAQDVQGTKMRPGDRGRSGTLRSGNSFEPDGQPSLPTGGGMLLGRQQTGGEVKRGSIVRFMADGAQVSGDNLVSDQHLTQNFGFSFIPEGGGMNPPTINASPSFIPPVTQPSAARTPAILPVEAQNTLPSFYPSYSPAAHPSLPSDIPLQYFSNQMFTSPSADKSSSTPLNNRFGSILSPPRPVGFTQASFPLLPDMPPMPIANSSSITPHLSNFNLTSLFPEIATAMPPDGTAMPMSPLLSLTNTSSADSSKQPNRPAHNISHILGHDGSSAV
ncbi:basic helix-loop-helix domain-containing protein USF3 isoform X1 [Conger conger]|uniref:basic helix-loop-helix domain-containing protein USF3 isoform X1 n=2 Tax=Conger conger TaxID=82655 RepID=UPI002A5A0937|nr:basic helix-loop-helix domain-containing protein USF3 isoform X1 [Conger conger]XP_061093880.1 basic helix-loop-helix domain-containing protein USF3 isoform X1 [Conger conger]XP_061093881.1 basic helix-loop-helix domain-containing protein USF3 isoform X1 [Conger conger]